MPIYHKLGKIPHKRHTVFKKEDGSLHYEQLFGTIGFDGMSSLMYHLYRPTMVKEVGDTLDDNYLRVMALKTTPRSRDLIKALNAGLAEIGAGNRVLHRSMYVSPVARFLWS